MTDTLIVRTSLLYGVYVSAKSYYIGLRCLVKREHAQMLASRLTGDKLPQELVDQVADYLYSMECRTVRSKWDKDATFTSNQDRFALDSYNAGPAETIALEQMAPCNAGVDAITIENSKPSNTFACGQPPKPSQYIHLSCTGVKPAIAMSLPGGSGVTPSYFAGMPCVKYTAPKGDMRATCAPNGLGRPPFAAYEPSYDELTYYPRRMPLRKRRKCADVQVSRLLQGCDIEEAIRNWDHEAIKKFVKLLNLHVVPFDGGDGLTPGVHIWQRVADL